MVRTDIDELAQHVQKLAEAQVLCVGDVMLDRFVYGSVDRVSPEAPIPILRIDQESTMLGGAGNVVRNLVALGAKCTFVSVIGRDDGGTQLTDLVAELDKVEAYLLRESARPSTIKTRYMAGGQQLLRADQETDTPLAESIRADVERTALDAVDVCDAVVLSDYGKGVLSEHTVASLIGRARASGKPVVVDPKGNNFSRYRGADVVTPNCAELADAAAMVVDDEESILVASRKLISDFGIKSILVTRSQEGMSLIDATSARHVEVKAQEVFDVSGAGDTVVAAFSAAIAVGIEPLDAVSLANVAAGVVVGKIGTAAVYGDDLINALHSDSLYSSDAKIMPESAALEKVKRWRQRHDRIGFTNGCFDLLHPGHISLLRQARESCDRLVVALNTDSSVTKLKGKGRPIQNQTARARVIASLSTVDLVVLFNEGTPLNLIRKVRPDLLIKGGDYRIDEVVGADLVQDYGGEVVLARVEPGYSTSDTIARIATS
ncbi:MAG: Bifunctional protein HldE [Alphaproteobacteria bacterium MarineAlpha9_Bin7]|nr:MAG: Bifunctional protein HldE [Alphaproteobacteria bacterium MarineAlpha9_Bin7]